MLEVVKLRESLAQTTEQQQETERGREEVEQVISQVCSAKEGKMKEPSGSPSCVVPLFNLLPGAQMKHPRFWLFLWFYFCKNSYTCVFPLNIVCLRSH